MKSLDCLNWMINHLKENPTDKCVEWPFACHDFGYGRLGYEGRIEYAHRIAYALHHNLEVDDTWILHKCDNPKCVNPQHLYPGDPKQNVRDIYKRGRQLGNGTFKLSEDDVMEIIQLLTTDLTHDEIASQFGVSRPTISMIANGRIWKHLPRPEEQSR
jgi:hypothetical protein